MDLLDQDFDNSEHQDFKHVAIAGNIGSGKTTLTEALAKHYEWEPHFEEVANNPYIDDFYKDMRTWSFHMQIYYLNLRFQQIMEIREGSKTVIQDRTIYEDAYIFAPNLHSMGLMSKRDFGNYLNLFETIERYVTPPDLLIYLRGTIPALVNQIQRRGREFEDSLRLDYLKKLNERYEAWIKDFKNTKNSKIMIIDIDKYNFADNPEDLGEIIDKINIERLGLFNIS
ncbi:MAG: deoxynucleoside kinase [Bacteroidetes bacterium]|jgi:deoxyadenosine/deoxycytidine kinase|nr:deoxynucleoside kinase [Bacteroidota bacterium]MBT5527526.1 deoxynucleoside kinase [Cytophagia bacterium]MBT3801329.1 deoxynucleoside kinase [Bacteroidota bacterium]MBT4338553.1 deoxynucleoside kinase [Bacteroidota bacterium]MBT4729200.1 deoxynucleoside kinase [Bacteroidota bacterium]